MFFIKRQRKNVLIAAVTRALVYLLSFSLAFGPSAAQAFRETLTANSEETIKLLKETKKLLEEIKEQKALNR